MDKKEIKVKKSDIERIVIITKGEREILEITTEEAKELAKDLIKKSK